MRVIHKFAIRPFGSGPQTITVSPDAHAVRFAQQRNELCVWIDYDTAELSHKWVVQIFGTGNEIPEDAVHLGSYESGAYIWHLYALRGKEQHN